MSEPAFEIWDNEVIRAIKAADAITRGFDDDDMADTAGFSLPVAWRFCAITTTAAAIPQKSKPC